jgi:hypothetical protein
MEFHFPHCALIHRSAWKGYSPKLGALKGKKKAGVNKPRPLA